MTAKLAKSKFVKDNTVTSWHTAFNDWLSSEKASQVSNYLGIEVGEGKLSVIVSYGEFYVFLGSGIIFVFL